jgi:hypothetical protein
VALIPGLSPLSILRLALAVAAIGLACGGKHPQTGTGGTSGAGGQSGTGGGSGGAISSGGATATGGSAAGAGTSGGGSGGSLGSGGSAGSGGSLGSGGGSGGNAGSGGSIGSGGGAGGSAGLAGSLGSGGRGGGGSGGSAGSAGSLGSGGRGGGGSGGSAGSAGSLGSGGTGVCGDVIDDMEAGTGYICRGDGRVGYWYTYIDATLGSSITPPASESPSKPLVLSPARVGTSTRAMHASGVFLSYAGIGFLVNAPVIDDPWSTFDASGRTGVHFYAKGTGSVRILLQIPATVATQYHGTCTSAVCVGAVSPSSPLAPDTWKEIGIPFSSLTSGNAPFNPALLAAIEFQPTSVGGFDLWIDDVSFY